jgi:hypothetical protein
VCDDATAVDIEVIPQAAALAAASPTLLCKSGTRPRAKTELVRVVALRWHSGGSELRLGRGERGGERGGSGDVVVVYR